MSEQTELMKSVVDLITQERAYAEQAIREALYRFQHRTGLQVARVDVPIVDVSDIDGTPETTIGLIRIEVLV